MIRRKNFNSLFIEMLGVKPIAFNPLLALTAHSALAGLFLSQLLYWWGKGSDKEWIYKTVSEIQVETCMTRSEQARAIRIWKELKILEVELRGLPRRRFFKINTHRLSTVVLAYLQHPSHKSAEFNELAGRLQRAITESTQKTPEIKRDSLKKTLDAGRKALAKRLTTI